MVSSVGARTGGLGRAACGANIDTHAAPDETHAAARPARPAGVGTRHDADRWTDATTDKSDTCDARRDRDMDRGRARGPVWPVTMKIKKR